MINTKHLKIDEFLYELPADRIAQFPLDQRDNSKLLIYKDGIISQDHFYNISQHLPSQSLMVFNETRVVHARLEFMKDTGGRIEIFCLEPISPSREIQNAFEQTESVSWRCLVGNSKKWKSGKLQLIIRRANEEILFTAERIEHKGDTSIVKFCWMPANLSFSEILDFYGKIPLPPYISRTAVESDKERYQTIYAKNEGSVAAPTAGLHFTDAVFESLKDIDTDLEKVTLHVGAGTFRPVSHDEIGKHDMHTEQVSVSDETIEKLRNKGQASIISVGTTTTRTLESTYWQGVKWLIDGVESPILDVRQWDPYNTAYQEVPVTEALDKVLEVLAKNNMQYLTGQTQLMIAPGYSYKIPDIMLTNFHQPRSTLLLLIAAFIGDDWRKAYAYAMDQGFRFLSYGDSCLFYKGLHPSI